MTTNESFLWLNLLHMPDELIWAIATFVAWLAGELAHRALNVPRISSYALIGFFLGSTQLGFLPEITSGTGSVLLLANIAFGLILFEAGHRVNLRWLRNNPWIPAISVIEASATFGLVYMTARWYGTSADVSSLLAALAMATSPATVLRVVNEHRSSGQVTERALHLSVLNCILAVFVFKLLVGYSIFETSGSLLQASYSSLMVLVISAGIGAIFGIALPWILRILGRAPQDATLVFAISVILLVEFTHLFRQSPVLATLAFGIVSRHRRIVLGKSERGFGALGDLLSVLLFMSVAASIHWKLAVNGLMLGLAIIFVRWFAKLMTLAIFARPSGISVRKGLLTGLAMTPFSVFVILVLEQTRYLGINLIDQLSALAVAALILELAGPILTHLALLLAHEVRDREKN